jgi:hypothetical protein
MEQFGWTYQQYEQRPLWFDRIYRIKSEAEAEYNKAEEKRQADKAKPNAG